jgi:hypothetical protein
MSKHRYTPPHLIAGFGEIWRKRPLAWRKGFEDDLPDLSLPEFDSYA